MRAASLVTWLVRSAGWSADDRMVMLEALRLLAAASPEQLAQVGELRRAAVWVGDKWLTKGPVYAISNPLIAEALGKKGCRIREPGGTLSQFDSLIGRYGLTFLDYSQGQVLDVETATHDPDLSQIFRGAADNLQADLAISDREQKRALPCRGKRSPDSVWR